MDTLFDSKMNSEIKIFEIDKTFYELKDMKGHKKIILHIVDNHRKKVNKRKSIGEEIPEVEMNGVLYYSYVYNEDMKDSYWKKFLPSLITDSHNFKIQKISFVLFASVGNKIFAIVGGGGIRVIKRYLNKRFGIELFEYLTLPEEDIVTSVTVRGISGRLTEQREIFRNEQTILDSLRFTEIPTKLNVILRDDLIDTMFDFMEFNYDTVHLEVGSYFFIKYRLTFEQLHELIKKINWIMTACKATPLSSFMREKDTSTVENLYRKILTQNIRDDMLNKFSQRRVEGGRRLDTDFIHPSLIQEFYECDRFELKAKNSRKPFFETNDRSKLYEAGLEFLFEKVGENDNQFDFDTIILGIRVYGYRGSKLKTHAMFLQHLTTEISYQTKPIFLIDNVWYRVKNDFVSTVNEKCIGLIDKNYLKDQIIDIYWDKKLDEGDYNLLFKSRTNTLVLDKLLGQNIELCDLLIEDDQFIYLIHVKDGFDAKIRDLTNQVLISANRLWNDINSGSTIFLEAIYDRYINKNGELLDKNDFVNKFKGGKEIVYVMAYNSRKSELVIADRIKRSKSNIAKYSLVQCVQDMTSRYPLKIFDIADVEYISETLRPIGPPASADL